MKHEIFTRGGFIINFVLFHSSLIQAQLKPKEKRIFDPPYHKYKKRSDLRSVSSIKLTQLYSRSSGKHLRILKRHKIDAKGLDGDKYAKLFFESDGFGRVRIKGAETNLYLCVWRRNKRLKAQRKGRGKKRCVWYERIASNGFTELRSAWHNDLYLAFNRKGKQKRCRCRNKRRSGIKHVQFLHRTWKFRHYRGRYRRINRRLGRGKYVTSNQWKKWKMSLK